jgi:mono/diheme cytochrome c family protein
MINAPRHAFLRGLVGGLALLLCGGAASESVAAETPPYVAGAARLPATSTEAGEVLLSELSCVACHGEESKLPPSLVWKAGPLIGGIGDRLRAEYVREFLLNPSATKPGTTMPNLLAGQPEAKRAELADDLTNFLMQLRGAPAAAPIPAGDKENGRELYHSVGCVACHSTVPLVRLAEKYAPGQLAQFLCKPLDVRPAGRMPDLRLSPQEAADIAAFIAPEPPVTKPQFVPDPAKAQRGVVAFQTLGCISCHGGGAGSKPLRELDPKGGCLSETPKAGVPHYPLSADQRTAIKAALQARNPAPEPGALARRFMLQRNCFACHARDGVGGPSPEVAQHFTSARDDLGDLGRLPPPLDGIGRKLLPEVFGTVLRGQNLVRTYMRVRMPDFGPELAEHLGPLFTQADADANETPSLSKTDPNKVGRNEAGRQLVGTSGYSCIACHDLHGHKSLGIGAYDLAEMPKRLRPEWMRDFLLNPAAYPTGTRMPAFWPKGKPMNPKIAGDAQRQIDSVRVYLTEVDQSLPPEGFIDHAAFELKPKDRPIIFRTFVEGAGTHAIAVGFPQGINVAFDARLARWGIGWRGRFLDADGTWNQRVSKVEKPLGEAVVTLENIGVLSVAGRDDLKPVYRGYRVGADGAPTFLYDLGALRVEDSIVPNTGNGLRRKLRITGQTQEQVQLRAEPPAGVSVRIADEAQSSLVVPFKQGSAELLEEITW